MTDQAYQVQMLPGDVAFCSDITGKQQSQADGGHGGWVAASFVQGVSGLGDTELKIQTHQKGESRPWADPATGWTHTVCLAGRHRVYFRPEGEKEYFVDLGPNQDLSCSNRIPHRWEVLEDNTLMVTVRTKS